MRVATDLGWSYCALRACLLGLFLAAGWGGGQPSYAQSPQWGEPSRPDDRGDDHRDVVHSGFVFVDGNYVEAPYEVRETPSGATINGHPIVMQREKPQRVRERNGRQPQAMNASFIHAAAWQNEAPAEQAERRGPPPEWNGRRRPMGPGFGSPRPREHLPESSLRDELAANSVVVVFGSQPPVMLRSRIAGIFLKYLADPQVEVAKLEEVLAALPAHASREQWQQWLAAYSAPAALATRLNATVGEIERTEVANAWTVSANRRLHNWSYPMTIFGMVMSVLSLGHLLKSPPKSADEQVDQRQRERLATATIYSLGLVVVLSGLDLAWTVLASQAGQMTEINPIGSQMIDSPWMLTFFKAAATLGSCGLLLWLRRHPRAQWAAWWVCLVCTVLTFRWLVLSSMFVT